MDCYGKQSTSTAKNRLIKTRCYSWKVLPSQHVITDAVTFSVRSCLFHIYLSSLSEKVYSTE